MNIGIMKQGKSILFDKTKWGPIGGDNEASAFIYLLAKSYPQHTFWIIGKSDYSRVFKQPLLPNIKDLWAPEYWDNGLNPNKLLKNSNLYIENEEAHLKYYNYIIDTINKINIKIDFCFVFAGMHFSCGRLFYTKKIKKPDEWARTIENAFIYQSYQNQFLDDYKPLYTVINTDPRHSTGNHPKDLVHMPFIYLSQINKDLKFVELPKFYPRGQLYHDWINNHKNVYSGVETIQLLHKKPCTNTEKRNGFALVLNQGINASKTKNSKPPRYIELKRYILDDINLKCDIYGKWDDEIIESDSRFKGPISPLDIQKLFSNIKYTLCIPIQSGWATAKFTEMASLGVIPFVTYDYASETNIDYIHPFLRIKDCDELKRKIEQIDSDNELYLGINLWLERKLKNMYTGKYLFDIMLPILNEKIDFGERVNITEPICDYYNKDYENSLNDKFKEKCNITNQKYKSNDDLFY